MEMEEGQCIYELVLDDEQIDSLIIALNEFKRSKNEFEFEVSPDTSIAFYHIDSEPKDDDDDNNEPEEGDEDDEGEWIDNKTVVVGESQVGESQVVESEEDDDDDWEDDDEDEIEDNEEVA